MRRGAKGGLIAIASYDASERHAVLRGVQCHQDLHSGQAFRLWRIDPCGGWFGRRGGRFFDEALRVFTERMIEGELARGVNGIDLAIVHLIRGHQADPGMVMVLIVPVEECAIENSGVLDAAEEFGKARLILQGLEVAFGEGLSLDVCGRLCERVTPRSASRKAVAFAFIGPPRSAWRVSWPGDRSGGSCFGPIRPARIERSSDRHGERH